MGRMNLNLPVPVTHCGARAAQPQSRAAAPGPAGCRGPELPPSPSLESVTHPPPWPGPRNQNTPTA
jgi:hypothetical protein